MEAKELKAKRKQLESDITTNEFEIAWKKLKQEVWKERWSFIRLVFFVWAFLAGAVIEHYYPELLTLLWRQ